MKKREAEEWARKIRDTRWPMAEAVFNPELLEWGILFRATSLPIVYQLSKMPAQVKQTLGRTYGRLPF